jgi:hypothetical protein
LTDDPEWKAIGAPSAISCDLSTVVSHTRARTGAVPPADAAVAPLRPTAITSAAMTCFLTTHLAEVESR